MVRGYTTIEQSKKLLELKINPESADMAYRYCICKEQNGEALEDWLCELGKPFDECPDEQIPCWSLAALLELMPSYTIQKHSDFVLVVCDDYDICFDDKTLIDAAYKMVCWLVVNGYIKSNK